MANDVNITTSELNCDKHLASYNLSPMLNGLNCEGRTGISQNDMKMSTQSFKVENEVSNLNPAILNMLAAFARRKERDGAVTKLMLSFPKKGHDEFSSVNTTLKVP